MIDNFSKFEIKEICKQYNIKNYTINKDGSINVNDDVNLTYKKLTKLPLKFNYVSGHFYCSGFLKNVHTGKFAYFSISDVRHFSDSWVDNILLRTASHEKDYTGGRNQSTTILKIGQDASEITQ